MRTPSFAANSSVISRCLRTIFFAWLLTIALLLIMPQTVLQVHAQEGFTIYVVAAGDNLSTIARRYNVTVAVLMAYNNIDNANIIRLGQKIRILTTVQPAPTSTPVPTAATKNESPATSGSTAPTIGIQKSSIHILQEYLEDKTYLDNYTSDSTPGAQTGGESTRTVATRTPVSSIAPRGGAGYTGRTAAGEPVYTVRRGDTLSGIASQFGVTAASIRQRNSMRSSMIIVSQRIIIPLGTIAPTPTNTYPPPVSAGKTPIACQLFVQPAGQPFELQLECSLPRPAACPTSC